MGRTKIILVMIVFLAAFLRFWQLGSNPPSLTWDEVAWGYNAYSLGIDGRDEFGKLLPIQYLESFGDFKPPVYAYLDILPVKIFGLNEFAVRFPSALFGVLTVLVTYFLTRRIFFSQYPPPRSPSPLHQSFAGRVGHLGGVAKRFPRGETIALLSALFLAISPWHINLSRTAFEANVATLFLILGIFLFLRSISRGVASFQPRRLIHIDTSGIWLSLAVVSFVLSMYTFNTARVVAPLLVLLLTIGFKNQLLIMKKQVLITIVVGIIFTAPLTQFLLSPQARLRFHEVNIFSNQGIIERTNRQIENDNNAWWSRVLHNRRVAFTVEYLKHYFDHFNPSFLFIKGDGNPKFSTQDVGQLLIWEMPSLMIGILFLIRKREGYWWIIPLWLLIGIIPAATARETPHALRIETTLPTWQILVAYGFVQFMNIISKIKYQISKIQIKHQIFTLTFSFFIFNFLYYYHGYYTHYPYEYSGEWQYGYKEAVNYIKTVENQYDKIVFTEALGRPYVYTLFYGREGPEVFRTTAKIFREAYGFVHVESYGKYLFARDPSNVSLQDETLYFDAPDRVSPAATILQTFYLLNGKPVLVAYTK